MAPKRSLAKMLSTKSCRLMTMVVLTSSYFLVELIVGYITHSLALVADSFHMLSDIIALLVGFMAVRYSRRETAKNTYGWQRAEVVGALVNTVFLFALCFTIFVDAIERLVMRDEINDPRLVLIVGGVGLAVNLLGILLFSSHGMGHGHSHGGGGGHGHSHSNGSGDAKHVVSEQPEDAQALHVPNGVVDGEQDPTADGNPHDDAEAGVKTPLGKRDSKEKVKPSASSSQLNMRGVFLHVLGDALGSVVVIISALIVMFVPDASWTFCVDPVLSITIGIIICSTTWPLFKQSSMILLQSIPTGIDIDSIEQKITQECECIDNIHEFHIWQLTGSKLIATMHISVSSLEEYCGVVEQATRILNQEGIYSITIQPEFICVKHKEETCPLPCRVDDMSLDKNKCCSAARRSIGNNKSALSMIQLQMEVNNIETVPTEHCSDDSENNMVEGKLL